MAIIAIIQSEKSVQDANFFVPHTGFVQQISDFSHRLGQESIERGEIVHDLRVFLVDSAVRKRFQIQSAPKSYLPFDSQWLRLGSARDTVRVWEHWSNGHSSRDERHSRHNQGSHDVIAPVLGFAGTWIERASSLQLTFFIQDPPFVSFQRRKHGRDDFRCRWWTAGQSYRHAQQGNRMARQDHASRKAKRTHGQDLQVRDRETYDGGMFSSTQFSILAFIQSSNSG